MNCLGIIVNAETGLLTIPEDKLQAVVGLCKQWSSRRYATRRGLQKLLGNLLYVHHCVPPARLFANRILQTLRRTPERGKVLLDCEFY